MPSLLNLPPTFQPIPLLTEPWFEFPDSYSKFPLAIYFTYGNVYQFSSIQFSCSVVSNSATPWLQHARLPCPSPTPGVYSNSCPSSQWCHPTISSSIIRVSSCLQLFLALASFPKNQFFPSGGQSIGVSALASFLPMNIQDWFPLGLTGWISLQSKGLKKYFHAILSIHPTLSPPVTASLSSMSSSPLLPYENAHEYYLSTIHIYVLIYDISLFLTYYTLYNRL